MSGEDLDAYERELAAARIGPLQRLGGPVRLADYDPRWPELYEREARRIRAALGDRIERLEHVGSTSVPGLIAKPLIDIVLARADPAREAHYEPAPPGAGYRVRIPWPGSHAHRQVKGTDTTVNLPTFGPGAPQID